MEDMGSELEIEDLARLIGDEIPNVASGNAHAEEKGLFSIPVGPYEETSIRNFHGNGNLMDGNISMSTLQQSSMDQMLTRKDTMPGDQSLALAFSSIHKYYEVPIARHLEQLNREPSWEACAFHSVSKQLNPAFSTRYMDTVQGMEKVSFPKKILARNTRLNAVDAMRFMSIGADKSANHVDRSRIVCSNSYVRHNNFAPATERIFRNELSSSALYLESANLKLVPERFNSVDEVRGKIFLMAKDQHGCRFLQRKFMEGTDEDIEKIFNEIIDHVVDLMVDPFGNYLVQKLLEVCNEDQRMKFLRRITQNHGEIILVSCDMHGTRAVQKVIETLKTQEQVFMIVSSLKSGMVTLMKNVNGNHVAQHCLDYLMPSSEVLFDAVRNSCVDLATDRHGCCVLQKYLTCSNSVLRDNLISEIAHNALVISQDQYGNYVVQFILRLKRRWYTEAIVKQLEGSFGDLAMQKYSSNVVEKCLESARECGRYL
ncbi:Pumilio-like 12, partial [Cucurbita argyrosperma subsp. argyrosperma]